MLKLPPTSDEYWEHSDKRLVDISQLRNVICKDSHKLVYDYGKREANCEICGYGFSFQVHRVVMRDGRLYDLVKQEYLDKVLS